MFKYLIVIVILILATSCATRATKPASTPTETVVVRDDPELIDLLNTLLDFHQDSTADVKAELEKTRAAVAKISALQNNSQQQTQRDQGSSVSKPDWLRSEGKIIVGSTEHIVLSNEKVKYAARIDTGATSSSIDAREITRFERDGDRWVRFKLYQNDQYVSEIERPIVRWVRIFQSDNQDGSRRPVVEMAYELGDFKDTAEFTLTDRSHLEFPVIIGRNIITDRMLVDVSDSYLHSK